MRRCLPLWSLLLSMFLAVDGRCADWPQFRCDAARSAAASRATAGRHFTWTGCGICPRRGRPFVGEVRLRFDAAYEPVVLGNTMFVPSMITDSVTALDTATGAERWRFFADGPVRFAPVAWEGGVYFVSDDGYLYCVDARTGNCGGSSAVRRLKLPTAARRPLERATARCWAAAA